MNVAPLHGVLVENATGIKKLAYRILPRHMLAPLLYELSMTWVRLTSQTAGREYRGKRNLLLNLGAGDVGLGGWVNVDSYRGKNINCVYDIRKRLPFDDNSARGIFCEHFLEHLDYTEEIPFFLTECHRVLEPGGVIRIVIPDAEKYLKAYSQGGWGELSRIRSLSEGRRDGSGFCFNTRIELINEIFRQGSQHKYAYDFETMEFLLERYGFGQIVKQEYGKSIRPEICLDQKARELESLYVEGSK